MPIRILVAKGGLDGHDRGLKLIATGLRSAGMEVVYLGLHQTPDRIVRTAADEAVQVVGLSCHAGEHVDLTRQIREQLDIIGLSDVRLVVGGVFPVHDLDAIYEAGAELVFRVGDSLDEIAAKIDALVASPRPAPSVP